MKKLLLTIATAVAPLLCMAGDWHYVAKTIVNESHKLNSAGRFGGQTRLYIPVNVPPWCVTMYYSISTYENELAFNSGGAIQLGSQVMRLIEGKALTKADMKANASMIDGYKAEGVIDVFHIPNGMQAGEFAAKHDRGWTYIQENSRQSFTGGTVAIDWDESAMQGQTFLGFRNNSALKAMYFHIEVVAVVKEFR